MKGARRRNPTPGCKTPQRQFRAKTNWPAYPIDSKEDEPDFAKRTVRSKRMIDKEIDPILQKRFVRAHAGHELGFCAIESSDKGCVERANELDNVSN